MHEKVRHPFFLYVKTITWRTYLDMLELYVVPHLEELQPFVIVHDGAPLHCNNSVQTFLNETFYGRRIWPWWIPGPLTSRHWISSSAGYVKDYGYRTFVDDTANLCARTVERNWCVAKWMWTMHGQTWTASMMWSGTLGVLMLRWITTRINV
jgi:hypothetical protein